MRADIIAVGNQSQYQNFFDASFDYLARELSALGITVGSRTATDADVQKLYDCVREASRAGDLVVVLPAPEAVAAAAVCQVICGGLGLASRVDGELQELVRDHAARTGRVLAPEEATAFAACPEGSLAIPNRSGLVQGYAIGAKKQLMLVLPASPSELAMAYSGTVRQLLGDFAGSGGAAVHRTLRGVELGDVSIREQLAPLLYSENPAVTLEEHLGECEINITAKGRTKAEAQAACDAAAQKVAELLGPYLTSDAGEPLAQQAMRLLAKARLTLAVAESGTGGLLAEGLRAAAQDSQVLVGGISARSNQQKAQRLGVSQKLLSEAGGVSRRVAAAMAAGVRKGGKASLGVAITCCPGPEAEENQPVGLIYVAVTDGKEVWAKKLTLAPDTSRDVIRSMACLQAMNMLRLYAQHYPQPIPGGVPLRNAVPGDRPGALAALLPLPMANKASPASRSRTSPKAAAAPGGEVQVKESKEMNLLQKIRYGKLTRTDLVRVVVLVVSLLVFIGCMVYIGSVFKESSDNKGLVADQQSAYSDSNVRPEDVTGYPKDYLDKFAALYAQNSDIAGWIKIDGTKYLNIPVVQTSDNDYYERRDFTKKDNQHGVAFVDYRVAQKEPSTNTIIYAHNMNDGQMFGELLNYKSLTYYQQHPTVSYDSVYYEGQYKIFGVVVCKKDDPDFSYHNFIEKTNDKEMTEYVNKIRERSIINTKVDVRTDDKLLTMSTCDYSFKSDTGDRIARFVIFARKVRDGESATVDVNGATINTNPVMPKEWFSYLQKQQEAELKKQQETEAAKALEKWLTASEKTSLSAEEKKIIAERRQAQSKKYLTYDEIETLDIDAMIYLMNQRETEFGLYLDSSEQEYSSVTKRLNLVDERKAMAKAAGLTEEQIKKAGNWTAIQKLINNQGNSAEWAKWLTAEELADSSLDKNALMLSRKAEAKAAGLTDAEIAAAKDWATTQKLMAERQGAADTKKMDELIAKNPKLLTAADKEGKTLATLQALLDQRKAEVTQYKIDLNNFSTWEEVRAAISAAQGSKALDELISANPKLLTAADKEGRDLAALQALLDQRKADVTTYKLNLSDYADWAGVKAAIDKAKTETAGKAEQAAKEKLLSETPPYLLNEADKTKTSKELAALIAERKPQAAASAEKYGLNVGDYANWDAWKAAVAAAASAAEKPPASSSEVTPPDPSSTTPPPPSESEDQGAGDVPPVTPAA